MAIVFYFQIHQPYRLKEKQVFEIGQGDYYGDNSQNREILTRVAEKCYLPANRILKRWIDEFGAKVTLGMTGVVLEQFEEFYPEVLESFKDLVSTGKVELTAETYYHSLAFVYDRDEFLKQVEKHRAKIEEVFGVEPKIFRNTELIYNDDLAQVAEKLGFDTVLAEGAERLLDWRSPDYVYTPSGTEKMRLMLRNYSLSDDVAFRFSRKEWGGWPLTAEKYAQWLVNQDEKEQVVNLFMDYETFGEHQGQETGILKFLEQLPAEVSKRGGRLAGVRETAWENESKGELSTEEIISWADSQRDMSAWIENPLQQTAAKMLYEMKKEVMESGKEALIEDWRRLTTSDHLYYMSTKMAADGEVHRYFSPHKNPVKAYTNLINVLHDLRQRVYTEN